MIGLPALPDGWRYAPLKRVAALRFSSVDKHSLPGEVEVLLCNYLDVYRNEQVSGKIDFMRATATPSEIVRFSLRLGDVLLTKDSEDPNDIGVPSCVIEELNGVLCGYHLALARPRTGLTYGPFLLRALQSAILRDQFYSRAVGVTRFALGLSEVGEVLVPTPPFEIQQRIATFLDRKTAAVDELVWKKERMIELLQEKWQALITHAVTKGIKPNVLTKESAVAELGRVPIHWQVWSIRNLLRARRLEIQDGNHGERHPVAADYVDSGIPFLMANNIRYGQVDLSECKFIPQDLADTLRIGFARSGDVLLTHKGTIGEVALVPNELPYPYLMLTPQVTYYRSLTSDLQSEFLSYYLQSKPFQEELSLLAGQQSTRGYVGITAQRRLHLLIPPHVEQEEICAYLRPRIQALYRAVELVKLQIKRIREYRQALISAAVAGQIDISSAKAA